MRSLQNQAGWYARAQWTCALVVAIFVSGFYLLGYAPLNHRQEALRLQIASRQRQLQADLDQARRLPDVARSVDALRLRLEHFDKKLPRRDDPGQFIRQVTQVSEQAALRKLSVQQGLQRRIDAVSEMPILLSFEGDFVSVFAFLRQLEQMERMTRVRKLDFTTTDARHGTVEVKMTVNIYSMEG